MTTRANELTPRAGAPPGTSPPKQPAGQLRAIVDALDRLGYNVASLLAGAGLRGDDLHGPDAVVLCTAFDKVIGGALAQRRVADLAVHIGYHTVMGAFPLLDYLVLTSDTVGDALRQLQRYFHVTSAPYSLDVVEEADATRLLVRPGADLFSAQYTLGIVIHHMREETEHRLHVSYVSLTQEPEDRRDLERLLGCPVRAPAAWSGIEFPRDAMRQPLRRRDPVLRRVLEGGASASTTARRQSGDDTVAARVSAALTTRIGHGVPEVRDVARQLAMASRTLQRRLAAERVSYKDLVDRVRRGAAERLLADRSLAVAEVGYLLGFSEPSAFHRAFKRWHHLTPQAYRARHSTA